MQGQQPNLSLNEVYITLKSAAGGTHDMFKKQKK